MKGGMELAQRQAQVRGAAAAGIYLSFSFLSGFGLAFELSFVSGDEG